MGCAALLAGCGATKTHYPAAAAAQEQLQAAEAAAPESDTRVTHRRLIEQMQREGMWYASLAHIDVLEQRTGASPELLRLRADALRQTGQNAASRAAYTQLSKAGSAPDAAAGLHGLGLLAGAEGDFVQASVSLEQARQRTPADARVLGDLGYARLLAGRLDEARVPLMQAAQLQPEDARAQLNLAAWLLASGQAEPAARILNAAPSNAARDAVHDVARRAREAMSAPVPRAAVAGAAPAAATVAAASAAPAASVAPAQTWAVANKAVTADNAVTADSAVPAPLALRGSSWQDRRRIHLGVRNIDGAAVASDSP